MKRQHKKYMQRRIYDGLNMIKIRFPLYYTNSIEFKTDFLSHLRPRFNFRYHENRRETALYPLLYSIKEFFSIVMPALVEKCKAN